MQNNFSILTVCTGNICRSPLAQNLLEQKLQEFPEITVSSAGTHAMVGESMFAESQKIALSLGVEDVESHRARQLSEGILESADLILTMTREQRRDVVELSPRATRRVFTVREFARLAEATTDEFLADDLRSVEDTTPEKLRAAINSVALSRSVVPAVSDPSEDEVIDPYRESVEVHQASAEQLVPALDTVANLVRRALVGTAT
ncbi:low molecular weight phosphatase family protein [Corynebacteriaceae bacterium 6-324]